MENWAASFSGRGDGEVIYDAFPEPYIGNLGAGIPVMVMLGLNPGQADLAFQGVDGVFTRQIGTSSYSRWAAGAPYTSRDWESAKGRNVYQRNRLAFARRWHDEPDVQPEALLFVELYPWHSRRVTGSMPPPSSVLQEWIWEPLADIDVQHLFAFGKPWLHAAEKIGLGTGRELKVQWATPSRRAVVFPLPSGQDLVVAHQAGYAGPPGAQDAARLRMALRA